MEGGFNKALLMTREDGTEVIAKIPCPNAGPAMYTTASEVAVLKYVKSHTTIPVPQVLAWSPDSANPIGTEYIIMEKVDGVQLFNKWGDMNGTCRSELIQTIVLLENQLASVHFPAYGSLYIHQSIVGATPCVALDATLDPSGLYCIGPSCERSWSSGSVSGLMQLDRDAGPWNRLANFGIAQARREIWCIQHTELRDKRPIHRGTREDQISLLGTTIKILTILESHPRLLRSSKPVLWHKDLHMGNIFVSQDDPSKITGIIDWQSTSVSPMFLQVRWPVFLEPPDNYVRGLHEPALPDDFDQLSSNEKEKAEYDNIQAVLSKMYEMFSCAKSIDLRYAMNIPRVFRELFVRCGDVSKDGVIPLRSCLIQLFKTWQELGLPGERPYHPTPQDIETHDKQSTGYEDWYTLQGIAMQVLDTDSEGWVPAEADWEETRAQNQALCEMFITKAAGEMPPETARRMWPFPTDDNTRSTTPSTR